MRYLPYVPLAAALLLVLALPGAEGSGRQDLLTGWIAILVGLSASLSGVKAVARGRVLVRTRTAVRDEQPGTFWATVILFRFGLAAVLLAAGVWTLA